MTQGAHPPPRAPHSPGGGVTRGPHCEDLGSPEGGGCWGYRLTHISNPNVRLLMLDIPKCLGHNRLRDSWYLVGGAHEEYIGI